MQVPPEYSAVHTGGERAYHKARRGEQVELKPRRVLIDDLSILSYTPPNLDISIHCSKGTYIRSFARDLGIAAGSRAYVKALRRTEVGSFSVEESVRPEEIELDRDILNPGELIDRFPGLGRRVIDTDIEKRVLNGSKIGVEMLSPPFLDDGDIALIDNFQRLLAIVEKKDRSLRYKMVVPHKRSAD